MKNMRTIIIGLLLCGLSSVGAAPPAVAFETSTFGAAGGSANAQTIAIQNVQKLNDVLGVPVSFIPNTDNTGPATIAIGGQAPVAVRRPTDIGLWPLSGGELQAGVTTTVMYNGSFIEIRGPVDMTPIGKTIEFRGSLTPRGTLIEDGSCVSRMTYAALFSVIGTNYSVCDGTATFGIPDSRGTMFGALDNQGANGAANRITSAGSGCDATVVRVCGAQNQTLISQQIPNITSVNPAPIPVGGATTGAAIATNTHVAGTFASGSSANGFVPGIVNDVTIAGTVNTGNAAVTSNNTSGLPHPILNPISLGRRAIKY